ncbi:MAG: hypothetical protein JXA13_16475 [Anaerolineales bacterium]|nr:hypothetical protein [Anaerolineales bacterium]
MKTKSYFIILSIIVLSIGCGSFGYSVSAKDPDYVAAIVFGALGDSTPEMAGSDTVMPDSFNSSGNQVGNVSGAICNLDETELNAFFQNVVTREVIEANFTEEQTSYEIELPVGNYMAYAWFPDYSDSISYSNAVTCGLQPECQDHSLVEFSVLPGQTLMGVNLCDRFHGPFDVPFPPSIARESIIGEVNGNITGYIGPEEEKLVVVAFNQSTNFWYWSVQGPGERMYTIENLPVGTYQVVAYDILGNIGGTPPNVLVMAGESTQADIVDWSGEYPVNPVQQVLE